MWAKEEIGEIRAGPLIIRIPLIVTLGPGLTPEELEEALRVIGERNCVLVVGDNRVLPVSANMLSSPQVKARLLELTDSQPIYVVPEGLEVSGAGPSSSAP